MHESEYRRNRCCSKRSWTARCRARSPRCSASSTACGSDHHPDDQRAQRGVAFACARATRSRSPTRSFLIRPGERRSLVPDGAARRGSSIRLCGARCFSSSRVGCPYGRDGDAPDRGRPATGVARRLAGVVQCGPVCRSRHRELVLEVRFVGRATLLDIWAVIALAASGLVGALIVSAHPRHPIGWMFCAAAVSSACRSRDAVRDPRPCRPTRHAALRPGDGLVRVLGRDARHRGGRAVPALLFPDGHLPSPRWRPVAYFAAATFVLAVLFTMVAPDTYAHAGYPSIRNPVGLDQYQGFFDAVGSAMQPLLFGLVVVSAVALFARSVRRCQRAPATEVVRIRRRFDPSVLVVDALAAFIPSLMVITDVSLSSRSRPYPRRSASRSCAMASTTSI